MIVSKKLILYLNLTFIFLNLAFTNCDHLQQTNDDRESSTSKSSLRHNSDELDQAADPSYIKKELKKIVNIEIDSDKDGSVSYEELKTYLANLHERNIEFNVDKQWTIYSPQIHEVFSWEGYEPERKEVLTWDHYFNQTYPELIGVDIGIPIVREQDTSSILNPTTESPIDTKKAQEEKEKQQVDQEDQNEDSHMKMLKQMVRRADVRWKLADENGDTLLTKQEFKMLLHPDEGHEGLQNLFVTEAVEDMDLNKDGKICLEEFMKHLKVLVTDQERNDQSWLSSQQENFGRFLDKNKDGVLDNDEIRDWLIPPKDKKHEAEAKRLFDIGDANEDHKLTVVEILENHDQFISLLPPEYWSTNSQDPDPSDQYVYHDEL